MASRLHEMENEGMIVFGRLLDIEFEGVDEIMALANKVDGWAHKLKMPLGLIYCGTTINWPDEFEYVSYVIGCITFSAFEDETHHSVPASCFVPPDIPDAFFADLEASGIVFSHTNTRPYFVVAGWAWAVLQREDNNGRRITVSTEDDGYARLNLADFANHAFTMRVDYC